MLLHEGEEFLLVLSWEKTNDSVEVGLEFLTLFAEIDNWRDRLSWLAWSDVSQRSGRSNLRLRIVVGHVRNHLAHFSELVSNSDLGFNW